MFAVIIDKLDHPYKMAAQKIQFASKIIPFLLIKINLKLLIQSNMIKGSSNSVLQITVGISVAFVCIVVLTRGIRHMLVTPPTPE